MAEKILIVEDENTNAMMLGRILEREGYTIQVATDGQEGVELALAFPPDLILLDISMPRKDGFQACTELKQDEATRQVPIIFLSGRSDTDDIVKGLEIGGNDYITKPFNKSEILARIRTQLKMYHLNRDLNAVNAVLQEKQKRIDEDLQAAAVIQKSLLPMQHPEIDFGRLAWSFTPCEKVGGDIFNFFPLDDEHWALYMLDVSGHGVPSAMISVSVSQLLNPQTGLLIKKSTVAGPAPELVAPAQLLAELDRLYPFERFQKYFTMSYVICNCKTGELSYSSAGHPPPLILRKNGEKEFLEKGGPIIGLGGVIPFEEGQAVLDHGDRLFLYTDGVYENRGETDSFLGREGLYELFSQKKDLPLSEAIDEVFNAVLDFGDRKNPDDDVSVLGFEFHKAGQAESRCSR
ncbi:MAG: fused response regulator/phosphatase [Desulfohalobiaceae bacterium]|nr:fused response regulator/phosphatase [Desulfohalobiaceae bacterium]